MRDQFYHARIGNERISCDSRYFLIRQRKSAVDDDYLASAMYGRFPSLYLYGNMTVDDMSVLFVDTEFAKNIPHGLFVVI